MWEKAKAWFDARGQEISTKLGMVFGAMSGAAALASALVSPWCYVAFAGAILMVVCPQKKKGPDDEPSNHGG